MNQRLGGRPAHDRSKNVFPLPAGADTSVTRPARVSAVAAGTSTLMVVVVELRVPLVSSRV